MLKSRVRLIEKGMDGSHGSQEDLRDMDFESKYRAVLECASVKNWRGVYDLVAAMTQEERLDASDMADAEPLEYDHEDFQEWIAAFAPSP